MKSNQNDVINYILELNENTIVGIGNIVGWGEDFINKLKEFKIWILHFTLIVLSCHMLNMFI